MTRVLRSILPPGPIHRSKRNGSKWGLEEGLGANLQAMHDFAQAVSWVRNPALTPILTDLEAEFGVSPSDGATVAQRVAVLNSRMFSRGNKGQYWVLQNAINLAGFTGIQVIPNDPAVNPLPFVTGSPQVVAGPIGTGLGTQYAGYYTGGSAPPYAAFAATFTPGTLIVAGAQYVNQPTVVGCGSGLVSCHTIWPAQVNTNICGGYSYSQSQALNYGVSTEPYKWPFFFFLAQSATFDGAGHVTGLTSAMIPKGRLVEFTSLVLHFKPIHSWGVFAYSAV